MTDFNPLQSTQTEPKHTYGVGFHILFTIEEYADYGVTGLVVVLKEFELGDLHNRWAVVHAELKNGVTYTHTGSPTFPEWLIREGFVETVPCVEINTGYNGEFTPTMSSLNEIKSK